MTKVQEALVIKFLNSPKGQEYLVKLLGPMIDEAIGDAMASALKGLEINQDDPADWWKKGRKI